MFHRHGGGFLLKCQLKAIFDQKLANMKKSVSGSYSSLNMITRFLAFVSAQSVKPWW